MNSSANWDLEISSGVFRALHRLPRKDAERLLTTIRALPADPYAGDIEKMKGGIDTWRRRVGAYRIFYKLFIRERKILAFHLERRTSTTY